MSGRNVMMGYMGSEEKTLEALEDSEEGWLRYVHFLHSSKISKFRRSI